MQQSEFPKTGSFLRPFATALGVSFVVVGCNAGDIGNDAKTGTVSPLAEVSQQKVEINNETKFSSKEFGVAGSPRVTTQKRVRKGGGRYQIGKPYKIRGKWYTPALDPNYTKTGIASWYGPNFHGRLTANGEIYDQYALSAAHPTMPLPSYARVTNLENGSAVTVRVNDRGPYSHGRVIDLSARAAKLLNYTKQGVAKVKVKYLGKARMDGLDESYLVASYRGGPGQPKVAPGASFPGTLLARVKRAITPKATVSPQTGLIASIGVPTERPTISDHYKGVPVVISDTVARTSEPSRQIRRPLAYSPVDNRAVAAPFEEIIGTSTNDVASKYASFHLATVDSSDDVNRLRSLFGRYGAFTVDSDHHGTGALHSLSIRASQVERSNILRLCAALGLHNAFEIRD